ncbi:hypothetical protein GCM10009678_90360 [Actinomadura kijaniata]|uniref:SprT-like domain-containing protein n=1 Tax=Actinomadura namibiensis TaxID=182080 RepID=A0A7W3LPH6_ACTNM|nr:hypothetical protein [Actinomadura namibiensis]MBA8951889.1 hypothetical protein [Actinomadura namibiensis]
MTARRPPDAASTVLRALEDLWHTIRDRHPEIPEVVLILASGTDGKHARWGHHAPARWRVHDTDRTEIMISGEGLRRPPREVLGTLLHEATHALAAARGVQDTSRQGRYHNTRFRDLGTEMGIQTTKTDKFGWSTTTVPDATATVYARPLKALEKAMVLWRRDEITNAATSRKSSNLIAAICPCERTIRIAASSLDQAPVTCGACGGDFEPK